MTQPTPYTRSPLIYTNEASRAIEEINAAAADTRRDLALATAALRSAAVTRDLRYAERRDWKSTYDELESRLMAVITSEITPETSKPKFSNDSARKAELTIRLADYPAIVNTWIDSDDQYRIACTELELAQDNASTTRALVKHLTSQNNLIAEIRACDREARARDELPF